MRTAPSGVTLPRFFVSDVGTAGLVGLEVPLEADDARHARTVLRARPGERCEVVVQPSRPWERGRLMQAVFADVAREVSVRLVEELPLPPRGQVTVALVQALPTPRKVDEVVEKGTEVGVDWFVIARSEGSPSWSPRQREERTGRWRRIAREAAKQSRQLAVPRVETATSLSLAFDLVSEADFSSVVLTPDAEVHLADWLGEIPSLAARPAVRRFALWVGPEGGWDRGEIGALTAAGAGSATLGWRVLRTETAGPVAAALVRFGAGER